jgi:hypothetical protein
MCACTLMGCISGSFVSSAFRCVARLCVCVVSVAAIGEGILKKLKVDIKQVLRDNRHIYDMYLEPEKKL